MRAIERNGKRCMVERTVSSFQESGRAHQSMVMEVEGMVGEVIRIVHGRMLFHHGDF